MNLAGSLDRVSPLDRFAFQWLNRQSADYFVDALCFARNARERVWCHLLGRLPNSLRAGSRDTGGDGASTGGLPRHRPQRRDDGCRNWRVKGTRLHEAPLTPRVDGF
jgi:hypothetical protein